MVVSKNPRKLILAGVLLIVLGVFIETSFPSLLAWLQILVSQESLTIAWAVFSSIGASIAPLGGVLIGAGIVGNRLNQFENSVDSDSPEE